MCGELGCVMGDPTRTIAGSLGRIGGLPRILTSARSPSPNRSPVPEFTCRMLAQMFQPPPGFEVAENPGQRIPFGARNQL